MTNLHLTGRQRQPSPENILPFTAGTWMPDLKSRPARCLCTWVPCFQLAASGPSAGSHRWPEVFSYKVNGYYLKFRNYSCPDIRLHG